ncbi:MAG: thiamine biosynthesis protein ThiS [Synechococcales cyanobacterium RM1_1_8]|nr:thiamine biosynthesis protein ThiS [Synechococcales cyanobacterium RM1_1_8]
MSQSPPSPAGAPSPTPAAPEQASLTAPLAVTLGVTLTVNGKDVTCQAETSLPQFLEQQGMNPKLVAVEYNGQILHRQHWETTQIGPGDNLEVVTIVGGG